jgi:hypothetical protein
MGDGITVSNQETKITLKNDRAMTI